MKVKGQLKKLKENWLLILILLIVLALFMSWGKTSVSQLQRGVFESTSMGTADVSYATSAPYAGSRGYISPIQQQDFAPDILERKILDILVNNAGIYFQAKIEETNKEQLDKMVDTNIKGTYLMCKYAFPLIIKNKGSVIYISSGLGVIPEPKSAAYCSTKAAIIMLTKCMAQEYASKGIRINAILPGPIDTPLLRNAFSSQKELDEYTKLNPMKRVKYIEDSLRNAGQRVEYSTIHVALTEEQSQYSNVLFVKFSELVRKFVSVNDVLKLVVWVIPYLIAIIIIWFIVRAFRKKKR